jgi:hypothetical protein
LSASISVFACQLSFNCCSIFISCHPWGLR